MDLCLSLKNGELLKAQESYALNLEKLFLVCSECGEPVYLKLRSKPRKTYFFSHYEKIRRINFEICSLRTDGSLFKKFSLCAKKALSNPQLVDKFQKEFAKEIYLLLEPLTTDLQEFRNKSNFDYLDPKSYQIFINEIISNKLDYELILPELKIFQKTTINQSISDVEMFLRSNYGIWIGNFIYQTAYFICLLIDLKLHKNSIGESTFLSNNENYFLIVNPNKLTAIDRLYLINLKNSDPRYKSIANIAGLLVSFMVIKWQFTAVNLKLIGISNHYIKNEKINKPISIPKEDILKSVRGRNIQLTNNDQFKVIDLIKKSAEVTIPKFKLDSIEKIIEWSNTKTPIDGLFLALYKDYSVPKRLTDNDLLLSWVLWAKEIYKKNDPST